MPRRSKIICKRSGSFAFQEARREGAKGATGATGATVSVLVHGRRLQLPINIINILEIGSSPCR